MAGSKFSEKIFKDQCGNFIRFYHAPSRIVSLVPSQTELLYDLGLSERITGITKYCAHPRRARDEKEIVGGTKNFDVRRISDLQPDFILGNKEENYKEGIDALRAQFPVWVSDIYNLQDALAMIRAVGAITGTEKESLNLSDTIRKGFRGIKRVLPKRVLYLIWRKPWMASGTNTFVDSMLTSIGLKNAIAPLTRYPEISEEQIQQIAPDIIMLSSEPFPFKEKHIEELNAISPSSKVMLVDGEMFSWYGSRLRFSPGYFNSLGLPRS